MMNGPEKSDLAMVAAKLANKAEASAREWQKVANNFGRFVSEFKGPIEKVAESSQCPEADQNRDSVEAAASRARLTSFPRASGRSSSSDGASFLADAGSRPGNCPGMEEATGAPSSLAVCEP